MSELLDTPDKFYESCDRKFKKCNSNPFHGNNQFRELFNTFN